MHLVISLQVSSENYRKETAFVSSGVGSNILVDGHCVV